VNCGKLNNTTAVLVFSNWKPHISLKLHIGHYMQTTYMPFQEIQPIFKCRASESESMNFCNLTRSLDIFTSGTGVWTSLSPTPVVQAHKFKTHPAATFSYVVTIQLWCFISRQWLLWSSCLTKGHCCASFDNNVMQTSECYKQS